MARSSCIGCNKPLSVFYVIISTLLDSCSGAGGSENTTVVLKLQNYGLKITVQNSDEVYETDGELQELVIIVHLNFYDLQLSKTHYAKCQRKTCYHLSAHSERRCTGIWVCMKNAFAGPPTRCDFRVLGDRRRVGGWSAASRTALTAGRAMVSCRLARTQLKTIESMLQLHQLDSLSTPFTTHWLLHRIADE